MAGDWLDELYDGDDGWAGESDTPRRKRRWSRHRDEEPDRTRVQVEVTHPRRERPSIRDAAVDLIPADPQQRHRLFVVAYNGSAAAAGWWFGLGPWIFHGLVDAGADHVAEGVWVGVGFVLITCAAELRTHSWRDPAKHLVVRVLGWLGRIPLATALLALALFGPDAAL